jgi:hypothetical protein
VNDEARRGVRWACGNVGGVMPRLIVQLTLTLACLSVGLLARLVVNRECVRLRVANT